MQGTTNEILIPTSYCVPHEPKYCQRYTGLNTFPYSKRGIHCYCSRSRVWGAYGLFDGPKHLPRARRRRGCVDVDVGKPIGVPRLQLFALTAQKTAICVICTQAKMCIELIGWDAEASAAEGRREPLSVRGLLHVACTMRRRRRRRQAFASSWPCSRLSPRWSVTNP